MDLTDALILAGVLIGSVAGPALLAWRRRKTWRAIRWMPIEDAPTDRPVLLSDGVYVAAGRWADEKQDRIGGWVEAWAKPVAIRNATHWAKMPGPPGV